MKDLGNYVCEGQMSLFDFIEAPSAAVEAPKKNKKKEYIPECCESCKNWLGECRLKEKADHDMCAAWILNDIPRWWGFLEPQEAVQDLFTTNRIISKTLECQVKNIYINFKEASDRIEKLRELKELCGQAWMPGEKELEEQFEKEVYGVTGYASSYTYGLTIRQRNFSGEDLIFGKYIPWEEVDRALWNIYANEYTGDADRVRETILHGSGFAGDKKRIIDFFELESELVQRAAFLKQEYGEGGWSTKWGMVSYGPSGLDFKYKEPQKMHEVRTSHIGWPMVAKEIGYLIQRGIYTADIKSVTESVSEPIAAVSEPKKCCGVTPWLKKSRCVQWDSNKPRHYMMAYICPKCGKIAVDNTGWPRYGYGTFDDAAGQALEIWNDKHAVFEIKDYNDPKNNNYIQILYGEEDEWEKLYGQKYDDYKRPIIQKANEEYRKRKANEEKM